MLCLQPNKDCEVYPPPCDASHVLNCKFRDPVTAGFHRRARGHSYQCCEEWKGHHWANVTARVDLGEVLASLWSPKHWFFFLGLRPRDGWIISPILRSFLGGFLNLQTTIFSILNIIFEFSSTFDFTKFQLLFSKKIFVDRGKSDAREIRVTI